MIRARIRNPLNVPDERAEKVHAANAGDGKVDAARDELAYRIVAGLVVLSIVAGAVLAGLHNWIPTNDGASTVLRAKHSLGTHPSLVGMYAYMSSAWVGRPTYFPGPWQLWWMAIPIRVLGTRWGPLLSMAVLNSCWFLLAGWLTKRRFGTRTGSVVLLFLAALTWSFGLQSTTTAVPFVMVVLAYAAFLFVCWAVSTGDDRALVWFALIGNFLLLDHLQLTRLVPMIGMAVLASWFVVAFRERQVDREAWSERKRRSLRSWTIAVAVSLVMWIPSIIEQVTSQSGNLTNLRKASGASNLDPWSGLSHAFPYSMFLYSQPNLWLRGSIARIGNLPPMSATVAATLALSACGIALAYVSFRRRDREAFCAVGLAVVVYLATWYNFAGTPFGLYFLPLWPSAMYVTFAFGFALVRALPCLEKLRGRIDPRIGIVGLAVLLCCLCFTPTPNPVSTMGTPAQRANSRLFNRAVIDAVRGRGTVKLAHDDKMFPYESALAVAMDDAGVPFCHDDILSLLGGRIPRCGDREPDITISINAGDARPRGVGTRVLAQVRGSSRTKDASQPSSGIVVTMVNNRRVK